MQKKPVPGAGVGSQMNPVQFENRVWIAGQHVDTGEVWLAIGGIEQKHDGAMPTRIPIRLTPQHGWENENLEKEIKENY